MIRLNKGERYENSQNDYKVVAVADKSGDFLFVAIYNNDYPNYKIFSLLDELNTKIEKLIDDAREKKSEIQLIMVELQKHYNDPNVVSLYYAQKDIDKVKTEMRENFKTLVNNIDRVEVIASINAEP